MTTLNSIDLDNLEKFLTWFTEQNEIPAKTRRDFIGHIMKTGYLDEHSANFIEKTMEYLENQSDKSREYWEKELMMWESFIKSEEETETSLAARDIREAEKVINEVTDEFVTEFKEAEKVANDKMESGQKSREISEIDMIKESLN